MTVIITKNGKDAQKINRTRFANESELQEYLYENPDIVPVYEIDEDIKLLILAREFATNSGPIDALGVDINGNLYIVETKLYKNTDKRTVIAQAIDYGASMWAYYKDFSDFLTRLDAEVNKKFGMSINQKFAEFFGIESEEVDLLIDTMKENLNKGIFKFVVLMDQLEPRLKDLIRFINQNSQFDVYAVELEFYKFDQHELMIPKIFGAEVKKDLSVPASTGIRKNWDENTFLSEMQTTLDNEQYEKLKDFYYFSKEHLDYLKWGSGKVGAYSGGILSLSQKSLFTLKSDGTLSFNIGWHRDAQEQYLPFINPFLDNLRNIGFNLDKGEPKQHYFFYDIKDWLPRVEDLKKILLALTNTEQA